MATAKFDIVTEALKPVYAYVGVTDLAVEKVRDAFAAVQKDVTARVNTVQKADPQALRVKAVKAVNARVDALAKDAVARREAIEARVAELQAEAKAYPGKVQTLVDDNVASANAAYTDLVKRGESLVTRIRKQQATQDTVAAAKTTVAKAKTTATQAKKAAEATVDAADKAAAEKVAPKPAAKKTAARKTAAKKATTTTARKKAAKKTTTAKSSAKATGTAAKKTATSAAKAVADAAEKIGD